MEIIVSAPHETTKTLKAQDDREWNIGCIDKLIVMGTFYYFKMRNTVINM